MSEPQMALRRETTGNAALDGILGGGIPAQTIMMVAGEPGSGKTILTLQMLFHAARQGKKSLYFTTVSEPAIKILRYMQHFDYFDAELVSSHVIFADLGSCLREGAERTLEEIEERVATLEPAFVAIDSFKAVGHLLQDPTTQIRRFTYDLAVKMASWGATTLLLGEYTRDECASLPEFAIADGIISLASQRHELTSVRAMEVLKLRGADYASGQHFYQITRGGVAFYPRVSAPADVQVQASRPPAERVATGVAGLDNLLGGGLPRGSATILQGATGTGKTLLSVQFLLEGARTGEKGILFTLEETPEQLRHAAAALGWDLAGAEAAGMIRVQYTSPVELSTDRFLHQARHQVLELGATRAVFDSLTTMALGISAERRFKEMVYAIAKHLRGDQVSLLMTVESEQLLGAAHLTGQGVSFIADNLVQMRYVEIQGRLERAISVLKARGIEHSSELRAITIGQGGLKVVEGRFKDLRGVLTGIPERERGAVP
jgi:circadian clock protein KaiC